MRKVKSLLVTLIAIPIGVVIAGIIMQIITGEKGTAIVFISTFLQILGFAGIDEKIWSLIIFVVLALVFCGSLYLSRRQENRLWYIASALAGIIGYLTLFKK